MNIDSPDVIHGRMKEGAHIAGYSLQRSIENLRWLLEDSRFEQLAGGYKNVNDFLRDTQDAFKLLNINPEERKQIAELVKELQPKASQRAIGDLMGVSEATIGRDIGNRSTATFDAITPEKQPEIATFDAPPAIPADDYDPIKDERRKREKEKKKQERIFEIESIETQEVKEVRGIFDVIILDPPWPYGTDYDAAGRRAANPYPEMSLEEISVINLPAANDCVLWLWTTHKFMRHAFNLLDHWGFRDVSILTWVKDRMGLGQWLRSQTEFCIMAVKGSPVVKLTNQTTVVYGPMREHSRKPDEFYSLVKELCIGRKYEYFSREKREGFEQHGNEVGKFNELE